MVRCHRAEFVQRQAVLAPAATRPSAWQERVADEDAVLAVSGVSASYGSTRVLHDVDLTVRKGTCLALVGESGSGKTTLARCLSGLHAGTVTGSLSFDGQPLPLGGPPAPPESAQGRAVHLPEPAGITESPPHAGRDIARAASSPSASPIRQAAPAARRELLKRVALPADYEHQPTPPS